MSIRHASEESVGNGNFPIPDVINGTAVPSSTDLTLLNGPSQEALLINYTTTGTTTGGPITYISSINAVPAGGSAINPTIIYSTISNVAALVSGFASDVSYTISLRGANTANVASLGSTVVVTPNPARAGYVGGGDGAAYYSTIHKFAFADDSKMTLSTGLNSACSGPSGFANSGVAGYYAGGNIVPSPYYISTINKFSFSTDYITTTVATLGVAKCNAAGLANSGTAGYVCGGSGASFYSSIDKLTFSNDSRATLVAVLTATGTNNAGFANSGTAGYINVSTALNKLTFSTDAVSSVAVTLTCQDALAGCANSGAAGYFAGGTNASSFVLDSIIDKITFSTDTKSSLTTRLSGTRSSAGGLSNNGVAGYFDGGWGGGTTFYSMIDKLAFSNESRTTLSATLNTTRRWALGLANSGTL